MANELPIPEQLRVLMLEQHWDRVESGWYARRMSRVANLGRSLRRLACRRRCAGADEWLDRAEFQAVSAAGRGFAGGVVNDWSAGELRELERGVPMLVVGQARARREVRGSTRRTATREPRNGHPWAPGRVIVSWLPCGCQGGLGVLTTDVGDATRHE